MPEQWQFDGSIVDETTSGDAELGPVAASGTANIKIGETHVTAEFDPDAVKAKAAASSETISVSVAGEVDTPIGEADGSAHAAGPSAHAEGEISSSEIEGKAGASAGSADASVHADVLGQEVGGSVAVGLKAEVGVHMGASTGIDLPIVSVA